MKIILGSRVTWKSIKDLNSVKAIGSWTNWVQLMSLRRQYSSRVSNRLSTSREHDLLGPDAFHGALVSYLSRHLKGHHGKPSDWLLELSEVEK